MSQVIDVLREKAADVEVRLAWLETVEPDVRAALATVAAWRPVVVVPLLLSPGYHSRVDIPAAVEAVRPDAARAAVLGPDPLLAAALADRLAEAGWRPDDAVVLAAAGSSDPEAVDAVREQASMLEEELGVRQPEPSTGSVPAPAIPGAAGWPGPDDGPDDGPARPARVSVGFGAVPPAVATAVAQARADGAARVLIAPYLLAPGFFSTSLREAGADLVAAPLGAHPAVVDLVLKRYSSLLRSGGA